MKDGLSFSGKNKKLNLVEVIEVENHPWFVGVQFHPNKVELLRSILFSKILSLLQ